ncbi:MAG: pyridoxamine 5'-phosphate oxidase family protein [Nitrospirae bacterium]|nr:pyridoxamine 5'-phosphate oxidase family protein [Nitrospirota bacterium]
MTKTEIVDFINRNPVFSLATCINNIPHVRNMLAIKVSESEVIFNVKRYKPVYQQLTTNPNVELCFYNKDAGTQLRIFGKAIEVFNTPLVEEVLLKHPDLQAQITKYGKEVISLFAVENWKATLWNSKNKEQTLEIK